MVGRSQVVRVEAGDSVGTGFLIATDLLLTAFHNVAVADAGSVRGRADEIRLQYGRPGAGVRIEYLQGLTTVDEGGPLVAWDAVDDWIVLRVKKAITTHVWDVASARMDLGPVEWETYGFPVDDGEAAYGIFATSDAPRTRAVAHRLHRVPSLQIFSTPAMAGLAQPSEGFSGAPVVINGLAVGMIREVPQEGTGGSLFACPIERVAHGLSIELGDPVSPLSAEHTETDGLEACELLGHKPPPPAPTPFPVLSSIADGNLFGGRHSELRELAALVARGTPIICLHAASGVGKTSLLRSGLCNGLRASKLPYAFVSTPTRPDLVELIASSLLSSAPKCSGDSTQYLAACLSKVRELAGGPPVIVVDQVEDLFFEKNRAALRRFGALLAGTHPDSPLHPAPCRWVLGCRSEKYGELYAFLRDAPKFFSDHPRPSWADLRGPDSYEDWRVPVIGAQGDPENSFLDAILRPIANWEGRPGLCVAADFVLRAGDLAAALARRRQRDLFAPLGPELQLVLHQQTRYVGLTRATRRTTREQANYPRLDRPEAELMSLGPSQADGSSSEPGRANWADQALESALDQHVSDALKTLAKSGSAADAEGTPYSRIVRALELLTALALDRQAGGGGLSVTQLKVDFGEEFLEIADSLKQRGSWIVVEDDLERLSIPHLALANAVFRARDSAPKLEQLGVPPGLHRAQRLVQAHTELFKWTGEINLGLRDYRTVRRWGEQLAWRPETREWWKRARGRPAKLIHRGAIFIGLAASAVVFASLSILESAANQEQRAAVEHTSGLERAESLHKYLESWLVSDADGAALVGSLSRRDRLAVVGDEVHLLPGSKRKRVLVLLADVLATHKDDIELIGAAISSLDEGCGDVPECAQARAELVHTLRSQIPPLPPTDPAKWLVIEKPRSGEDAVVMLSREPVRWSSWTKFSKNGAARGLFVAGVSFYEAYAFAAWRLDGGRLPTESEWKAGRASGDLGTPATREWVTDRAGPLEQSSPDWSGGFFFRKLRRVDLPEDENRRAPERRLTTVGFRLAKPTD